MVYMYMAVRSGWVVPIFHWSVWLKTYSDQWTWSQTGSSYLDMSR